MTTDHRHPDVWAGVAAGDVLVHVRTQQRYVVADLGVGRGPVLVKLRTGDENWRPVQAVPRDWLPARRSLTTAGRLDDPELLALLCRLDNQPPPTGKVTPGTVVRLQGEPQRLAVLASGMTRTGLAYLLLPPGASYGDRAEFTVSDPPFRRHFLDLGDPLVLTWDDIEMREGRLSQLDTREMQQARCARGRRYKPQRGDLLWAWACFPPSRGEKLRPCIVLEVIDHLHLAELLVAPASSSPRTSEVLLITTAQLDEPKRGCPDNLAINLPARIPLSSVAGRRVARVPQPLLDAIESRARLPSAVRR